MLIKIGVLENLLDRLTSRVEALELKLSQTDKVVEHLASLGNKPSEIDEWESEPEQSEDKDNKKSLPGDEVDLLNN